VRNRVATLLAGSFLRVGSSANCHHLVGVLLPKKGVHVDEPFATNDSLSGDTPAKFRLQKHKQAVLQITCGAKLYVPALAGPRIVAAARPPSTVKKIRPHMQGSDMRCRYEGARVIQSTS